MQISLSELKELMDLLGTTKARPRLVAKVGGDGHARNPQGRASPEATFQRIIQALRTRFKFGAPFRRSDAESFIKEADLGVSAHTLHRAIAWAKKEGFLLKDGKAYTWGNPEKSDVEPAAASQSQRNCDQP